MKGDSKVIDYLNKALRHELSAVNQYWLHYRLLDNWGYKALSKQWRNAECDVNPQKFSSEEELDTVNRRGSSWHHPLGLTRQGRGAKDNAGS